MQIDIKVIAARLQTQKGSWRLLSEKSGVPYFTMTKIARGTITNPTIDTLNKLLAALDEIEGASEQAAA